MKYFVMLLALFMFCSVWADDGDTEEADVKSKTKNSARSKAKSKAPIKAKAESKSSDNKNIRGRRFDRIIFFNAMNEEEKKEFRGISVAFNKALKDSNGDAGAVSSAAQAKYDGTLALLNKVIERREANKNDSASLKLQLEIFTENHDAFMRRECRKAPKATKKRASRNAKTQKAAAPAKKEADAE